MRRNASALTYGRHPSRDVFHLGWVELYVACRVTERHATLCAHIVWPLKVADDARRVGYPRVPNEREYPT